MKLNAIPDEEDKKKIKADVLNDKNSNKFKLIEETIRDDQTDKQNGYENVGQLFCACFILNFFFLCFSVQQILIDEFNHIMAMLIKQRRSLNQEQHLDFLNSLCAFQMQCILAKVQNAE